MAPSIAPLIELPNAQGPIMMSTPSLYPHTPISPYTVPVSAFVAVIVAAAIFLALLSAAFLFLRRHTRAHIVKRAPRPLLLSRCRAKDVPRAYIVTPRIAKPSIASYHPRALPVFQRPYDIGPKDGRSHLAFRVEDLVSDKISVIKPVVTAPTKAEGDEMLVFLSKSMDCNQFGWKDENICAVNVQALPSTPLIAVSEKTPVEGIKIKSEDTSTCKIGVNTPSQSDFDDVFSQKSPINVEHAQTGPLQKKHRRGRQRATISSSCFSVLVVPVVEDGKVMSVISNKSHYSKDAESDEPPTRGWWDELNVELESSVIVEDATATTVLLLPAIAGATERSHLARHPSRGHSSAQLANHASRPKANATTSEQPNTISDRIDSSERYSPMMRLSKSSAHAERCSVCRTTAGTTRSTVSSPGASPLAQSSARCSRASSTVSLNQLRTEAERLGSRGRSSSMASLNPPSQDENVGPMRTFSSVTIRTPTRLVSVRRLETPPRISPSRSTGRPSTVTHPTISSAARAKHTPMPDSPLLPLPIKQWKALKPGRKSSGSIMYPTNASRARA